MQSPHEKVDSIYRLKQDPTAENIETIRGHLDDPDKNVRATALYSLVSIPVDDSVDLCLAALKDDEPFLRATAADLLGELGDPETAGVLIERLLEDGDSQVRYRAAESLGTIGGGEAVSALVKGLQDPIKEVRLASAEGLGENDPTVAIEIFGRMVIEDTEWEVRVQAARVLGKSGSASARPAVLKALEDSNEFVRSAAAHALALIDKQAATDD